MNLRWRQHYGQIVMTLFAVFFVIYTALVWLVYDELSPEWFPSGRAGFALALGLLGGWGFSGQFGGFWLTFRFISQKSSRFKILCCVLFFLPLWIGMLLGMTVAVPYAVYGLVSAGRAKRRDPEGWARVNELSRQDQGAAAGKPAPICMYKDTYALYLVCCLSLAALLAVAFLLWRLPVVVLAVLLVAGVLAAAAASGRIAAGRIAAISDLLRQDCDPYEYIRQLEELLAKQKRAGNQNFLLLQLSSGWLSAGEPARAYRILEVLEQDGVRDTPKRHGDLTAVYLNNLAACQIALGQLAEAEETLEGLAALLRTMPEAKAARNRQLYTTGRYKLSLASGKAEGCAQYFSMQTDLELFLYRKIDCQYHLARAHLLAGDKKQAETALRYVAEKGNKLHTAEEARRLLEEIQ